MAAQAYIIFISIAIAAALFAAVLVCRGRSL
jgi:hypothetical protein